MPYDLPEDLPFCEFEPRSRIAWQKSGLNPRFVKAILDVATAYSIIILIRANNPNYIGLLDDQYTTKSMFVHSKTCSWGPMTGFVCLDPSFHKKRTQDQTQMEFQMRSLIESISHPNPRHRLKKFCSLRITERRLTELESKNIIRTIRTIGDTKIIEAPEPQTEFGELFGDERRTFQFELIKEVNLWKVRYYPSSSASPIDVLNLCYDYARNSTTSFLEFFLDPMMKYVREKKFDSRDVFVLVDPNCPYPEDDFRCATTGDYDLFGFHPLLSHYAAQIHLARDLLSLSTDCATPIPTWIQRPSSIKLYEELLPTNRSMRRRISRTLLKYRGDQPAHQDAVGFAESPHMRASGGSSPPHAQAGAVSGDGAGSAASPLPPPSPTASSPGSPRLQGAMSQRELHLIEDLNHRVNYGGGSCHALRLFHHGPDSHNPHGEKPDLPCVALIPCASHYSRGGANCFRAVYIDNERKLTDFYFWNIICSGYALTPGINLRWFDTQNPILLTVCNSVTESHRQILIPYRHILNTHIGFERYLSEHHTTLLENSGALWPT